MNPIYVGKVSDLPTARWHLDINGWAHCGAGRGRTQAATRWRIDGTIETARVCKRCLKALRRRLAENAAAGDGYAEAADFALTPTDPTWEATRLADIRAHIVACRTPEPTPLELSGLTSDMYRRRLLASLAAIDTAA